MNNSLGYFIACAGTVASLFCSPLVNATPVITKISAIAPTANQTIIITGSGFTTANNVNAPYLLITDVSAQWDAGVGETYRVTLNVTSWTDTQIIVSGFTGMYGSYGWILSKGDMIDIKVANLLLPAGGMATCTQKVGSNAVVECLVNYIGSSEVADLNANGFSELATLFIDGSGNITVKIKDSGTKATISTILFGKSTTRTPKSVASLPSGEIAVLFTNNTAPVKATQEIRDALTGALIADIPF
jgi:hypothetical protein